MLIQIEPRAVELPKHVTVPRTLSPLVDAVQRGGSLTDAITAITRSMGYTTFAYGASASRELKGEEKFYIWSNAPPEWVGEYDQRSYIEIDPRVTYAWVELPPPLIWDARIGHDEPRVMAFLDAAAAYGIGSGIAIYLHDYNSRVIVALSQPQRKLTARRRAQMAATIGDGMAMASIFHLIFMKQVVAKGLPPMQQGSPLSARERQCLQFAAHGMTSHDIGEKLGITERTANFHFSNILSKLGALNRKEAIAKGMCNGLIHVDPQLASITPVHPSKIRDAQLRRWEALRNSREDMPKR